MASDKLNLRIHTAQAPETESSSAPRRRSARRIRLKTRLSFQERLLRNSCVACAVLLGVLTLGNLEQPWAVNASRHIEQALTMHIDLDQSLGQLSFVRKLVPESALVFFDLGSGHEFCLPVRGELSHAYTSAQPWLMFACDESSTVCSIADGSISAVSTLSDGSIGVMIDHGNGMESVYANLQDVQLQPGEQVPKGGAIGTCDPSLYFELRQNGAPANPMERMGL